MGAQPVTEGGQTAGGGGEHAQFGLHDFPEQAMAGVFEMLGDAGRLQFRGEFFNAFNHQNLGIPNSNWCLPPGPNGETDYVRQFGCSFGQITNVQTDPRGMEFSMKFQW